MNISIAIDGPVGAGKSTVASSVAEQLGILHLDTGAMYRAFAWYILQQNISPNDKTTVERAIQDVQVKVEFLEGKQHTFINQKDVTGKIRTPEVSMATSAISAYGVVRDVMVQAQRKIAESQSVLMDGRDIGTKVMPNATVKIYITATPQVRAKRRFDELQQKNDESTFEQVLCDVMTRDERDMSREIDPLRPATDAQILDTSEMTQDEVVQEIVRRVEYSQGKKPHKEEKFPFLYRIAQWFARFLFSFFMPVCFHNTYNLLMDAPYIIIANHNSMLDPFMMLAKSYRYPIRFLSKKELMKNGIIRKALTSVNVIAVNRHNSDMQALRSCLNALKEGHSLGIFPEGTRYKKGVMDEIESGVAMIALRSGCPVIPMYFTDKPRWFKKMDVYVEPPMYFADIRIKGINKESCDEVIEIIKKTYKDINDKISKN